MFDEYWTSVLDTLACSEEAEGFAIPYDQAKSMVEEYSKNPEALADVLAAVRNAPAVDDE